MGDRLGRVPAIRKAMMGMAISTVLLAALPVGGMIPGVMTLLYFTACRCAQSFFLGGQYHGGAIYCLEHTARARHGAISGWYGAATVAGMIMASLMATAVTLNGSASAFRWAYGLGACIMFFGGVYRLRFKETPVFDAAVEQGQPVEPLGWSLSSTAFRVLAASFFISFYFGLPTRVFNVLLPSQWGMNQSTVMGINTACLAVYMLLLPWAGGMADRFGMERMLRGSLLWIGLSTPLLLLVALQPTAWALVAVKLGMMVLAAFYIAPFHGWAYGLFRTRQRYGSVATAATLGKILSMVGLSLSVRLWEATGSLTLPSLLESLAALGLWYYLGLTRKVKASSKF
jgi:MHS family proline/betaine transporter-like MFS transporter